MAQRTKKVGVCAGIDVSQRSLSVAWRAADGTVVEREFTNDGAGHRELVRLLRPRCRNAKVVVEATGNYSVDVAIAIAHAAIPIMIANPLATRRFADAKLRRAKTDRVDALDLLDFAERMEFVPWAPPSEAVLQLRDLSRHISALADDKTAAENQLHAAHAKQGTPQLIIDDLVASIASLKVRAERLTTAAVELAMRHDELRASMQVLTTVKGIADRSAVRIMGELLTLPTDMTPDQVVAHAGLAPRTFESGTSVRGAGHLSKVGNKRLRTALFMPVLVAVQHEPVVRAAYEAMLARNKPTLVAQVALMRRLLRVLWRMIRTKTAFDPAKFMPSGGIVRNVAA